MPAPHLRLPILLGILAVVALGIGIASGTGSHQPVATGGPAAGDPQVATPVLSARRVPAFVSRGIAARRLQAAVAPTLARLSGDACFTAAADGTVLVDRPASGALMPASNQKLATAYAALQVLDPKSTLSTKVVSDAPPSGDGTVATLWFVGGGDPLISTANYVATSKYGAFPYTPLATIADQVVAAGVKHVAGPVLGDDTRYDDQRSIPTWSTSYMSDNQVGPLTALAVNDAKTYPATDAPGPVSGAQAAADPAAYAAEALTTMLRARGVVVDGAPAAGRAPDRRTTLVDVPSLPVEQLVGEMLTFSDNNTAELLLKEMGMASKQQGTTAAGIEAVAGALREAGLPVEGYVETDGSGLDRGDRATCEMLRTILTTSGPTGTIHDSLPVGGETGTLQDRFRNAAVRGKVRAKTGTLRDVTALSGWVDGAGGSKVAFSFVLNTGGRQVTGSDLALSEQLAGALTSYPDSPSPLLLLPKPATSG